MTAFNIRSAVGVHEHIQVCMFIYWTAEVGRLAKNYTQVKVQVLTERITQVKYNLIILILLE